jgi:predicted restriction endonuclease
MIILVRPYEHTKAIKKAKEKELHKCQLCGSQDRVQGHHIKDYGFNGPATVDNIIVVCFGCHKKLHRGEIQIDIYDFSELE